MFLFMIFLKYQQPLPGICPALLHEEFAARPTADRNHLQGALALKDGVCCAETNLLRKGKAFTEQLDK